MKTNCIGNKGFMAMKLDMSEAYDRVEWSFLEKILNIFWLVVSLRLMFTQSVPMHGEVFCKLEMLLIKGKFGGWGMVI